MAAAVEAKPLLHSKDFGEATESTAPTGTWHCNSDWWMVGDFYCKLFEGFVLTCFDWKLNISCTRTDMVVV